MSGALHVRLAGQVGAFSLDVALEAAAGEVTALTGPSGAGKSSVLRAIAGLDRLAGEVRVGDEAWQAPGRWTPPHRRAVGFVFQHAALLPHLSVRANLEYGRRRARAPREALDEAVARLRLQPLLERGVERLSGGERQRVAVARALATRPAALLLDEPLSGVDAAAKDELLGELAAAFADLAAPVLYVSHDAAEVARVAARTVMLRGGRVEAANGEPDRLRGRTEAQVRRLARAALEAGLG